MADKISRKVFTGFQGFQYLSDDSLESKSYLEVLDADGYMEFFGQDLLQD